jgi:transcriptional regulator with XRE-family HTH domain
MQYDVAEMSTPEFADWFRRQLKRRGWKQADFVRASGVPSSTVSAWYRGVRVPDPPLCETIAECFDLPLDDVLVVAGHRIQTSEIPPDDPRSEMIWLIEQMDEKKIEWALPIIRQLLLQPLILS